jgi:4-hydroxy-3-polyprenylbenzoate decarboxylase
MGTSGGRIVVGMTGEEGLDYGVCLLRALAAAEVEVHLVLGAGARETLDESIGEVQRLAHRTHAHDNQAASISSGSFLTRGMVVAPCSPRSAAAISLGLSRDLVERAADVTLKEQRPLVLAVPRAALREVGAETLARLEDVPGLDVTPLAGPVDDAARILLARLGVEHEAHSA